MLQLILVLPSLVLIYSRSPHLFPVIETKSKKPRGEGAKPALSAVIYDVDILGAGLIVCAILAPTIAMTTHSDGVAWSDPAVFVPLAITPMLWAIFVAVEKYIAKEPIVRFKLFTRNGLTPSLCCTFFVLLAHNAVKRRCQ